MKAGDSLPAKQPEREEPRQIQEPSLSAAVSKIQKKGYGNQKKAGGRIALPPTASIRQHCRCAEQQKLPQKLPRLPKRRDFRFTLHTSSLCCAQPLADASGWEGSLGSSVLLRAMDVSALLSVVSV